MSEKKKTGKQKTRPEGEPIIEWESPEFHHYKKEKSWFAIVGMVGLGIAALLYKLDLPSGALVALVAVLAFMTVTNTRPRNIKCAVYDDGVMVNGNAYGFTQFKAFWLIGGELPRARLDLIGQFTGEVTLPLKNANSEKVYELLRKKLPENERGGENLVEFINRLIKF